MVKRLFAVLLLACLVQVSAAFAKELDYHNVLIAYMAKTGDNVYTKMIDDWMQAFRPQIWDRYRNDEFAIDERRNETSQIIKADLSSYSENDEFEITTNVQFGDYNFSLQKFELHPFSTNSTFTVTCPISSTLPPRFLVFFMNADILDGFSMQKEDAKRFLDQRKIGGGVDRTLVAHVRAKIRSATADYKIGLEIVKISLLDTRNSNHVVYALDTEKNKDIEK